MRRLGRIGQSAAGFLPLAAALLMAACGGSGLESPGSGTATPTPTPSPTPPGSGDTIVVGQAGLCASGDVARVDVDAAGRARFALVNDDVTCSPAKNNKQEEYTMIVYNTTSSPMTFRIDSPISASPPSQSSLRAERGEPEIPDDLSPPHPSTSYTTGVSQMNQAAHQLARSTTKRKYKKSGLRSPFILNGLEVSDEVQFRVRSDTADSGVFTTISAILRAQGTHINIFVDRDVPFGVSGNEDSITQTQLQNIVTIFEQNIFPLEGTILGEPSDVDEDGRISVVITPVLNRDLDVQAYTDSRSLLPFDPISNPGSNEGEVIFVYAPDSLGNYKAQGNGVSANAYVSRSLNAWIAVELSKIISFNEHVLVSEGEAEDAWIDNGVGAVMADLAGFNIFRPAAYLTLAQPQLSDLRKSADLDSAGYFGTPYLFMLYYLQAQIGSTLTDANGDNINDKLSLLNSLVTSGATGFEGLESVVDFSFNSSVETEFQAIFKDWTIAIATSGTNRSDLQQTNQTAVRYFLNFNPTQYGSSIVNGSGSTRKGADGGSLDFNNSGVADGNPNAVGLDLNNFDSDSTTLIENADEHTFTPGNAFFGYVDPFSAMYLRLGGLFQSTQTISLKGSSSQIKGFLIRRGDVTYPHVYSESIFGSIDQHAENLDTAGPNPFWSGKSTCHSASGTAGAACTKKIDIASLFFKADGTAVSAGAYSQDYLTIVGNIDKPSQVKICPSDTESCVLTDVPDTDKYMFTVPDISGRSDEGDLAFVVRRQFDNGADTSGITPVLAIVSSKDVPFPYVPHPNRALVSTDTREQYRWLATQLICGDDQASGDTGVSTNESGIDCAPATTPSSGADSLKIIYDGLVENTGAIPVVSGASPWDGDILGGECDGYPDQSQNSPIGVCRSGGSCTKYGSLAAAYAVTTAETSPSSLGRYPWSSTFMTAAYTGSSYPDVLFDREFIKPISGYPSTEAETMFDPRSINSLTLNCHIDLGSGTDPDETPDSPDSFLEPSEIFRPASLAEQVLAEMARGRKKPSGAAESTSLSSEYNDNDVFGIDGDSRDTDTECNQTDLGNNLNEFTVRSGEGALLWGNYSLLEPHIANQYNNSALRAVDSTQNLYVPNSETVVRLTPGKNYTLIVGSTGLTSTGSYEIRIRKINASRINPSALYQVGTNPTCDAQF